MRYVAVIGGTIVEAPSWGYAYSVLVSRRRACADAEGFVGVVAIGECGSSVWAFPVIDGDKKAHDNPPPQKIDGVKPSVGRAVVLSGHCAACGCRITRHKPGVSVRGTSTVTLCASCGKGL